MAWFRTDPQEVLKETVLWTNPAPTSSFALTDINVGTIADYDYIIIEIRSSVSTDIRRRFYYKTSDLVNYTSNTVEPIIGIYSTNGYFYYRAVVYIDTQTIRIANCYRNTPSSTAGQNNEAIIPTQIIGIKRGIEVNPMFDLSLPPDAKYQSTLSNGATYTLAVTQKPKYVVLTLKDSASSSTGSGYLFGIVNVETGVGYRYGYWSSAFRNDVWTNLNSYITSITDNSVTIANMYGTACYTTVGAYY